MGLFAGGTMTFLLVGMIVGNHPAQSTGKSAPNNTIEPSVLV
jgi:hypothetical protein